MSLINRFKKELFLKIVYVGPTRAGKSENLRRIYEQMEPRDAGGLLTAPSASQRPEPLTQSLFFDFLPLSLGTISDFQVRLHLFSLPGSGRYDAIIRLLMRGVDGLVYVFPATPDRVDEGQGVLADTHRLLESFGKSPQDVASVVQYTHLDSPRALPQQTLRELYNPYSYPEFLSDPSKGKGVMETLRGVAHEALEAFKVGRGADPDSPSA
jgi:signal recognition particle receptor subunit beta